MLKRFKPKSEFTRNVLTLVTGTTIAQAIPIAVSPILTRIYSPDDFGVLALYIAIVSIFGSIASGRYELAILLPKEDDDAINILALGIIISTILSIILLLIVIIFNDFLTEKIGNSKISFWLYIAPISIFMTGVYNCINYFSIRFKNYNNISKANIFRSLGQVSVRLVWGSLKTSASGLISGQVFATIIANITLIRKIQFNKPINEIISFQRMKKQGKKYIDFVKYSLPGSYINTSNVHFTNMLISSFYSVSTLGFYSFVQKILGMPSSLIGGSIGQVLFKEAALEKQRTGKATIVFRNTIKKLLIIGVPSFGILFFIVEDLFALVFGEEWRIAGRYAHISIPLFFISFIASPISIIMTVFEKQKIGLFWQFLMFIISLITLFVSKYFQIEFEMFLKILVFLLSLVYIFGVYICYYLSKYGGGEKDEV